MTQFETRYAAPLASYHSGLPDELERVCGLTIEAGQDSGAIRQVFVEGQPIYPRMK